MTFKHLSGKQEPLKRLLNENYTHLTPIIFFSFCLWYICVLLLHIQCENECYVNWWKRSLSTEPLTHGESSWKTISVVLLKN